jgi:hypothetical protein
VKRIPISAAKKISTDYDCPEVVIFAYDPKNGDQHVTTYGKMLDQCKDAAKAGNYLKRHLGWPEELCNSKPLRQKKEEAKHKETNKQIMKDIFSLIDCLLLDGSFSDDDDRILTEARTMLETVHIEEAEHGKGN